MNKKLEYSLEDLPEVVKKLKQQLRDCSVVTFAGPLGAGKTTLIKELLKQYGITDTVTSPTFTYMNLYENDTGKKFYHFDLYRIENLDQFLQAGFDEYLYQPNSISLIEWPEPILSLLKDKACHITFDYTDNNTRALTIK